MKRLPRILKIIKISFPNITCAFNTAEYRRINVIKLFERLGIQEGDFGYEVIKNRELFNTVSLENNSLAWKNLMEVIKISEKEQFETFLHLDPIVLYKNSVIDPKFTSQFDLGKKIRSVRKRFKLTQETVAESIGSNKQYISKIENNKADLEFKTLKKIFELGLNRNLFISHYQKDDILRSHSNSILSFEFIDWAVNRKKGLTLIEGIDEKAQRYLEEWNIKTTNDLSSIEFTTLLSLLSEKESIGSFYHPELWLIQAKFITSEDWLNVIHLQRTINAKDKKRNTCSKIEEIAKKEINNTIFEVD